MVENIFFVSGNLALSHLTEDELVNRYICEVHFESSEIKRSIGCRTVLEKTAVPKHFENEGESSPEILKVKIPTKVYKGKRKLEMENENNTTIDVKDIEPEFSFHTPKKSKHRIALQETPESVKVLKHTVTTCTKKLKSQRISIKKLKNKMASKNIVNIEKFPFTSETSKTLTKMQLKRNSKKWTKAEKNLCLAWYYRSPSMYRHMRKSGIVLAAQSTIKVWLKKASCLPGLAKVSFDNIKRKFENATDQEKACVVCFDEMASMACLEYNERFDLIEGFEDLGKGQRTEKTAKTALVFIARGLYKSWKIPLAYFLCHTNVKAENLKHIIKRVLRKALESDIQPKAVVCDQGTTNVSALKQLGVTSNTPFFMVDNTKIFSVFDVPHIIKNLRNNLLTNNFVWRGDEVSFKDIIDLYNIDKKTRARA